MAATSCIIISLKLKNCVPVYQREGRSNALVATTLETHPGEELNVGPFELIQCEGRMCKARRIIQREKTDPLGYLLNSDLIREVGDPIDLLGRTVEQIKALRLAHPPEKIVRSEAELVETSELLLKLYGV